MINKVIINGVLETKELKIYGKAFKKAYIKIATTKKHSKKIIIVEGIIYERLIKKIIINKAFNLLKNSVCCYSGYLSVDKNYMYHNENGAIPPPSPFDVLSPEKKEIAQFFKDNIGTQFNAKQLSAIFHKSDVSIRQHLRGLTEKGFLKKVKTGIYEYDPDNFYEQQC